MANVLLSTKAVGSTVKLKVNGTAKEFIVVHQGKPSSLYDDSCNGTWLLMKDIYENRVWQSGNINKYESSDIHTYGHIFSCVWKRLCGSERPTFVPFVWVPRFWREMPPLPEGVRLKY